MITLWHNNQQKLDFLYWLFMDVVLRCFIIAVRAPESSQVIEMRAFYDSKIPTSSKHAPDSKRRLLSESIPSQVCEKKRSMFKFCA